MISIWHLHFHRIYKISTLAMDKVPTNIMWCIFLFVCLFYQSIAELIIAKHMPVKAPDVGEMPA